MASPKTLASDLLERINDVVQNRRSSISEFELRRLKNEAEKSLKADAITGYIALGALAAISWDEEGLRENHLHAIRLSDSDLTRGNFAASLANTLLYEEAFKEICMALKKAPADLKLLKRAILYGINSGHIAESESLYSGLRSHSSEADDLSVNIEKTFSVFTRLSLDENELIQANQIVFDTLRKHRFLPSRISRYVDTDPGEEGILFSYHIDANSDVAQRIHDEVTLRLCEALPASDYPDALMFRIVGNC